jgi:rRNA processing protein Krr1/Pno1
MEDVRFIAADGVVEGQLMLDGALRLRITPHCMKILMGKRGSSYGHLEELTGADISIITTQTTFRVPRDQCSTLCIKGTPAQVWEVYCIIRIRAGIDVCHGEEELAMLNRYVPGCWNYASVPIKEENVGRVIGRYGATVRSLQEMFKVWVIVPEVPGDNGFRTVSIYSKLPGSIDQAITEIRRRAFDVDEGGHAGQKLHPIQGPILVDCIVENHIIGSIMGENGETIALLQEKSGARITLKKEPVYKKGLRLRSFTMSGAKDSIAECIKTMIAYGVIKKLEDIGITEEKYRELNTRHFIPLKVEENTTWAVLPPCFSSSSSCATQTTSSPTSPLQEPCCLLPEHFEEEQKPPRQAEDDEGVQQGQAPPYPHFSIPFFPHPPPPPPPLFPSNMTMIEMPPRPVHFYPLPLPLPLPLPPPMYAPAPQPAPPPPQPAPPITTRYPLYPPPEKEQHVVCLDRLLGDYDYCHGICTTPILPLL